jgi:diketogulonate reductase-like aldo/keto reductase
MAYNERALAAALMRSGIPRAELFVTTKIPPKDLGYSRTKLSVMESLQTFGTSYLDVVMIHFSRCQPEHCTEEEDIRTQLDGGWRGSWKALQELAAEGIVRALGVSHFPLELLSSMTPLPHITSGHFDPWGQNRELRAWCVKNGVAFAGMSTINWWTRLLEDDPENRSKNPLLAR